MAKRALGKGIGALIGETEDGRQKNASTVEVPIGSLKPNPSQPRRSFRDASLAELAESIRRRGVLQPVLVEEVGSGYQIVAGERRVRAAKLAGLDRVPVLVRSFSPDERLEVALIENLQREDLTPIEEAKAYRQLMEARELTQEQVAAKVGKDRTTVTNSLRLLKLPQKVQDAVEKGDLSAGHARALLAVTNPADQELLFARVLARGLSVRETEQAAQVLNQGKRGKAKKPPGRARDPDVRAVEERLVERFGTKVQIRGGPAKGRIEIAYFSADDLERVIELLQGRK
ncbi:MAG TPA: ParB/RepB/Spo0J family partition protein [Desulfobacterales bacterium]|nr:ParB/RepB/Spo0J family partition protein [Desulfobacterales bacterium]